MLWSHHSNNGRSCMRPIEVLDRDICEGHTDLTVVPCSGKMKRVEKSRNQARIDYYELPSPHDLRDKFGFGQISPIFPPTKNDGKISFFAFAASVLNRSDPGKIESIGRQLGKLTADDPRIRVVEAPFLGCGDGGLMPSIAIFALAKGFLETHHSDATLQLCSDSAVSAQLARDAIDELYRLLADGLNDHFTRQDSFDYEFALSFAGEQRNFVQSLVYMLKAHGVRVFYDNDEQGNLWGKNLYDYLFEVYAVRSRYCVVLISKEYLEKEWTNHERQAAQDRAFREKENEYILPIRFDGSALRSLPSTIGYVDASLGVERIFQLLMEKIR